MVTLVMLLALGLVLFLWGFWGLYVLIMGLYRAKLAGKLTKANKVLGAPYLVVGYVVDIVANATYAWWVFEERPRELLVTTRLTRYVNGPAGWRKDKANLICAELLDPFDPTNNHCNRPAQMQP